MVSSLQFGLFPVSGILYDVVPFGASASDYTIAYLPGTLSIVPDQPSQVALAIPPVTGTASGSLSAGGQSVSFTNVAVSVISGGDGGPSVSLFQLSVPGQLGSFTSLLLSNFSNTSSDSDRLATE